MKLLPKQEHAVYYLKDKTTKEIIYGGAAGGGKSALGCLWLIEMCQKYKGSRWLMGRAKLKALKETTLNTFFEQASKLGVSNQFSYNAQANIIYWDNGSEILMKDLFLYPSDPNFDALGSLEICGAFIDECNQVVYKAWQIVTSRCRYKLNDFDLIPKVLGSCNPAKNWTYKQFYKANKNNELLSHRKFIQALPTDNPHLPQSYLDSLLSLDKNSRQRLYFGNWEYDDDPSALISQDAISDYLNPVHVKKTGEMFMTIDVARKGRDNTVYRVWDGFLCVKRVVKPVTLINEVVNHAKELMQKYNVPLSRTMADEDGVGGGVVDYLNCLGFVNNSKPLNNGNYSNLKTQCSVVASQLIEDRIMGEIIESEDLADVISEEMEQIKLKHMDRDGKIEIRAKHEIKEMINRSPDDWDTIMMRAWFHLTPRAEICLA